ncbi:MAG: hypothetical protein IID17_10170 [Nitrospinae bacterium]|nr:hypothetical protein [Nitrospinota bacterium]
MSLIKKFWLVFLLASFPLGITASSLYGQMENNPQPPEEALPFNPVPEVQPYDDTIILQPELFQWPPSMENSELSLEKEDISESTFVEEAPPPTYPKEEPLEEKVVEDLPTYSPQEKRMVEVPPVPEKAFDDAGDFRDPFFLIRGFQENSAKVLQPGVTVDGLRFFSYANSDKFIEKFYRNSNFSLDKVFGKVTQIDSRQGCLRCHTGIEEISANHKFRCTKCHAGNRRAKSLSSAHKGMVSNPSDLEHVDKFCGKCHADQIEKVGRSAMATAKGMINITRYAWGAQPYGEINYSLRPNPEDKTEALFPPTDKNKKHPVDAFLQTKCLRCHLQGQAPHRPGDYRATGCAACHMIYGNDGLTMTRDRAIQSKKQNPFQENKTIFQRGNASRSLTNKRGYPLMHKFTLAIPSVQCEHCHNDNGIGNEFEGLLRKPARPNASSSKVDAEKPLLYGSEHEFLTPDIHRERGMHCIDCHGSADIKGAPPSSALHSKVEIRCEDCHGTHSKEPGEFLLVQADPNTKKVLKTVNKNPNLRKKIRAGNIIMVNSRGTKMPHIKRDKNQWVLYSKVTGKKHVIPVLKNIEPPPAHQIPKHMASLECHTCHARWSASDWGMHLIRETSPDLEKWQNWSFSDPTLQQLLSREIPEDASGKMLDWLTAKSTSEGIEGEWIDGVWWDIFTETSWKDMILGKNARGKYSIMKPRYQYFITDRTEENQPSGKRAEILKTVDGKPSLILVPHTPHTIRKSVRSCESCHDSMLAVGLGDSLKRSVADGKLFAREFKTKNRLLPRFQLKQVIAKKGPNLQTAVPPKETRFLNKQEVAALANKSDVYRAFRYLNLRRLRYPRLLARNSFPYDLRHKANEKKYGLPALIEDLYYDFNKNQFFASGTSLEDILEKRLKEVEIPQEAEVPPELEMPQETEEQPQPGFDTQPEFRDERQDERIEESAPSFPEPVAEQEPDERFSESSEPPAPPKKQTLDEEGNAIIEFFQGIFKEGPPPPTDDELDQQPLTE